jgi:hypothetical protein
LTSKLPSTTIWPYVNICHIISLNHTCKWSTLKLFGGCGAADVRIMAGKILGALRPTSVWLCKAKATDFFVGLLVVRPWARWAWRLLGRRSRVYAVQGRSRSQMIAHSCIVVQFNNVQWLNYDISLSHTDRQTNFLCYMGHRLTWYDMIWRVFAQVLGGNPLIFKGWQWSQCFK